MATRTALVQDSLDLDRLEQVVSTGLRTFVDVGLALAEIRDRKLYLLRNGGTFTDFDTYCRERWGWSKTQSNRLIGAASVVGTMRSESAPIGVIPTNEAQARELIAVPAEKRGEVMQEAAKASAPNPPKAKDIAAAARPYVPMAERLARAEKADTRKGKEPSKLEQQAATRIAAAEQAEREAAERVKAAPAASVAPAGSGKVWSPNATPALPSKDGTNEPGELKTNEPGSEGGGEIKPASASPSIPRVTPSAFKVREAIRSTGLVLTDPTDAERPALTAADREWFQAVNRWAQLWLLACPSAKHSTAA